MYIADMADMADMAVIVNMLDTGVTVDVKDT